MENNKKTALLSAEQLEEIRRICLEDTAQLFCLVFLPEEKKKIVPRLEDKIDLILSGQAEKLINDCEETR